MSAAADQRRTILVTGAAGPAGRTLGAQLARTPDAAGLRVLGVDLAPAEVPGYEQVGPVTGALDHDYEQAMIELLSQIGPDLVLPTVAEELPRLATLGAATGLGSLLVLSAPASAAIASDKLLTMWALDRAGVPVPQFGAADRLGSAEDALAWADGPFVVKPRVARGGRGVHVVEAADDPAWQQLDGSWVVQSFAPGTEYSPQVYRSPATGACVVVVLEKTGRKQGRVGNATSVTRLPDGAAPDVAQVAAAAVTALDLVGPIDLDVRRTTDGSPVVLEVNARFGAVCAEAPELLGCVLEQWPG